MANSTGAASRPFASGRGSFLGKAPFRKAWRALRYVPTLFRYFYYHKLVFGVTNTRFDISFCVFKESFARDQYRLRSFLGSLPPTKRLTFIDLGRNHGFIFYYFLHFARQMGVSIAEIDYVGIDPSPLKFVYHPGWPGGPKINYRLIDRAVVFDGESTVRLKYGEGNFGNFNVSGSNFAEKRKKLQDRHEFIEIEVDTIGLDEIRRLLPPPGPDQASIVKIDCKNRTDVIFFDFLEQLQSRDEPYLVACERDGSSGRDLTPYTAPGYKALAASNLLDVNSA